MKRLYKESMYHLFNCVLLTHQTNIVIYIPTGLPKPIKKKKKKKNTFDEGKTLFVQEE